MDTRKRLLAAVAVAAIGVPLLSACSDDSTDDTSSTAASGVSHAPSQPPAPTGRDLDLATTSIAVDLNKAIDIAGTQFAGKPVSVQLQRQVGVPLYRVTLVSDTQEADINIDANTGEVRGQDVDTRDDDDDDFQDDDEPFTTDGLIEPSAAMSAATKKVPGAVSEWELKRDDGRIVYEVDIDSTQPSGDPSGDDDGDVVVDARTGQILGA